jgi:hypothetical protein
MKPTRQINRREVLAAGTAVAAVTIVPCHVLGGLRFTNSDEANQLINPPYRDGWSL